MDAECGRALQNAKAPHRLAPEPPIRVLAVEDVVVNRELMRLFLEGEGYEVDLARDGIEAVRAVSAKTYDIVFMDMQMPGMDGPAATRAIRAMGDAYAGLPIIALSANTTAHHGQAQAQEVLDAGMNGYLSKPFTAKDLSEAVQGWVGERPIPSSPVLAAFAEEVGWASVKGLLDLLSAQIEAFERCAPDDFPQLQRQAHALRGASAILGYADLATACKAVELASCSDGDRRPALKGALCAMKATKQAIRSEIARAS